MREDLPPFDAVLFDGDGVVFDSEGYSSQAFIRLMQRHGLHFTEEQLIPWTGVSVLIILEALERDYGLKLDKEQYQAERDACYREICLADGGPRRTPGIGDLLDALQAAGKPWALATSASADKLAFNLEQTALAERFPVRVLGHEVPRGKPAPDIFEEAARRIGADPARCLVLEDSVAGLRAARAAGATPIAIAGSHPEQELRAETRLVFADPAAVLAWLRSESAVG